MIASDCLCYGNRYNQLSKLLAGDILGQRAIPAILGAARTSGVWTPGQGARCHGHNKSILTPDPHKFETDPHKFELPKIDPKRRRRSISTIRPAIGRVSGTGESLYRGGVCRWSGRSRNVSIWVDDLGWAARFHGRFGWSVQVVAAAVHGPAVEDGRDDADDQRAADGGPEP